MGSPDREQRLAWLGTGASLLAIALLLSLHYLTAPHAFGVHDLLRRLFHLPVVTAAVLAGVRGGLVAAAFAGLGYIPHLGQLAGAGDRVLDHVLEFVLLLVVGLIVGGFADAARRARAEAAERGRLAALGEVSSAVIAQAEGPLAAIGGLTETLAFHARNRGDRGLGFTAEMIREQVDRTRRFLADLRSLRPSGAHRLAVVSVPSLLEGLVSDIATLSPHHCRIAVSAGAVTAPLHGDRAALACAFRSLLLALLRLVPMPGRISVAVRGDVEGVRVEISAITREQELADLERGLCDVFGPAPTEYHFGSALCIRQLEAEGARVRFRRVSRCEQHIEVRFPASPLPGHDRAGGRNGTPRSGWNGTGRRREVRES